MDRNGASAWFESLPWVPPTHGYALFGVNQSPTFPQYSTPYHSFDNGFYFASPTVFPPEQIPPPCDFSHYFEMRQPQYTMPPQYLIPPNYDFSPSYGPTPNYGPFPNYTVHPQYGMPFDQLPPFLESNLPQHQALDLSPIRSNGNDENFHAPSSQSFTGSSSLNNCETLRALLLNKTFPPARQSSYSSQAVPNEAPQPPVPEKVPTSSFERNKGISSGPTNIKKGRTLSPPRRTSGTTPILRASSTYQTGPLPSSSSTFKPLNFAAELRKAKRAVVEKNKRGQQRSVNFPPPPSKLSSSVSHQGCQSTSIANWNGGTYIVASHSRSIPSSSIGGTHARQVIPQNAQLMSQENEQVGGSAAGQWGNVGNGVQQIIYPGLRCTTIEGGYSDDLVTTLEGSYISSRKRTVTIEGYLISPLNLLRHIRRQGVFFTRSFSMKLGATNNPREFQWRTEHYFGPFCGVAHSTNKYLSRQLAAAHVMDRILTYVIENENVTLPPLPLCGLYPGSRYSRLNSQLRKLCSTYHFGPPQLKTTAVRRQGRPAWKCTCVVDETITATVYSDCIKFGKSEACREVYKLFPPSLGAVPPKDYFGVGHECPSIKDIDPAHFKNDIDVEKERREWKSLCFIVDVDQVLREPTNRSPHIFATQIVHGKNHFFTKMCDLVINLVVKGLSALEKKKLASFQEPRND